jgi:hypothetical protein
MIFYLSTLLTVLAIYATLGAILFVMSTPIQGQEYDDTADLGFYVIAWPIEIYRMYKYNPDEED